jgi:hypothetical protein
MATGSEKWMEVPTTKEVRPGIVCGSLKENRRIKKTPNPAFLGWLLTSLAIGPFFDCMRQSKAMVDNESGG